MQDVVRGVERARAWPRPKGSNQTPAQLSQQEWFRQANWAFKYADSKVQASCRKATHRTSLYPRDIFTMMAKGKVFTLLDEDNFRIWPLAYVLDVSASLDAISQIPGTILIRDTDRWRAIPLPDPPTGAAWQELSDVTITTATANLDTSVAGKVDVQIEIYDVVLSASGQRIVELSTDNGATYWTASGNYQQILENGTLVAQSAIIVHGTANAAARSGLVGLTDINNSDAPKYADRPNVSNGGLVRFQATNDPITNVRVRGTAGNMTAGRVRVIGR